eukprot:TRINITY_DN4719_c0_g1_i3.p1 TRINITY_DN4719_c0_g1~~TRINITY_DN4719_c0_g1_i3.p1  ORF type:complete len:223 (-),score=57.98 TRINITY_DN4719_c0_g1_i3:834-1502(-)
MKILILSAILLASTLAYESTLKSSDPTLAEFKYRALEFTPPISTQVSATYKLDKSIIELRTLIGKVTFTVNRPTLQLTNSGNIYISPLEISDEQAKDIDFALNANFGTNSFLGRHNGAYALAINVGQAMVNGYPSDAKTEDNMATWVFNLLSKTGNGVVLKFRFEEAPKADEFNSFYDRLGFSAMQFQYTHFILIVISLAYHLCLHSSFLVRDFTQLSSLFT